MSKSGKHIVAQLQKRWQLWLVLEAALYGLAICALALAISGKIWVALTYLILTLIALLLLKKPWRLTLERISQFLDGTLNSMENSTGLLLIPEGELSDLALLQRFKVQERLKSEIHQVSPKVDLKKAFLVFLIFTAVASLVYYFDVFGGTNPDNTSIPENQKIVFQALDSAEVKNVPPQIEKQKLTIRYPKYTGLTSKTSSNMNIKTLEGSKLFWNIQFDTKVDSVFMESNSEKYPMKWNGKGYTKTLQLNEAGFYNFTFKATDGSSYSSELYALEVVKDEAPKVEIRDLKQFNTFNYFDEKVLKFKTSISDDYGVEDAYIVATVSKGEGESVKFREERLSFEEDFKSRKNQLNLTKTIRLDALRMEVGDELYFYIEAIDIRKPKANRTRSETFFAVVRDTVSNQFAVEGTMGADLMPDYFRSQRQLIIDTEKLIANTNRISKEDFNFTSNELGYDQKALRLKYGEFMGDEADSGLQVTQEVEQVEESDEEEEENPLAEYTHDHDGDNEHNLVDHEHEEESAEETEDPLHDYLHNHDDPEESTLFTQSLKSKLRQAMAEMWDSELYLRLYTPERSLPYQYRALKLIQEIKNSARIYVHRIGFDPPPIKEDKRLSGDIDEVQTYQKKDEISKSDKFASMRKSVHRIGEILQVKSQTTDRDKILFSAAGRELATLAIESPGKYLETLQKLKRLSEQAQTSRQELIDVQSGLLQALPESIENPDKDVIFETEIDALLLKELDSND